MIEIEVDGDFVFDNAQLGGMIGRHEAVAERVYCLHAMAFPDGRLAIRSAIYFDRDPDGQRDRDVVQIEISDGGITALDLSEHAFRRDGQKFASNDWASIPFGDSILYLQDTAHAFVVLRGGAADGENRVRPVRIEAGIEDVKIGEGRTDRLRPGRVAKPTSEDGVAMIPLDNGSRAKYLATLVFNAETQTARWQAFPGNAARSTARPSLISRIFGKKDSAQSPALAVTPITLSAEDFARIRSVQIYEPSFNKALLRKGRVHIFTTGASESLKGGCECSDIAEIDADGRVVSKFLANDYCSTGDAKSRGLEGRFSTSGRYFILHSIYQSTDPWKGQQKFVDMDSGAMIDIRLPRGFTKFRIIDHAGEYFWAEPKDHSRDTQRYVRFRGKQP